jgi:hypothetical protein
MHFRGDNLDIFKPRAAQFPRHPLRRALHVRLVFAFGANARNPEKFLQLVQIFVTL